jgi:hypothetical protein
MRYALIYGGIAGTVIIAVISAGLFVELPDHFQSEWFGYLVMLAGLSLIFVAVKRYRDVERGGIIRFLPALGLGLGVALVAALLYVLGWEAVLAASGRDFIAEYGAGIVQSMQADGATAAAIQAKQAELAQIGEAYKNPLFRMPITFLEIAPVGLIVALVSAAILRDPRVLPARRTG